MLVENLIVRCLVSINITHHNLGVRVGPKGLVGCVVGVWNDFVTDVAYLGKRASRWRTAFLLSTRILILASLTNLPFCQWELAVTMHLNEATSEWIHAPLLEVCLVNANLWCDQPPTAVSYAPYCIVCPRPPLWTNAAELRSELWSELQLVFGLVIRDSFARLLLIWRVILMISASLFLVGSPQVAFFFLCCTTFLTRHFLAYPAATSTADLDYQHVAGALRASPASAEYYLPTALRLVVRWLAVLETPCVECFLAHIRTGTHTLGACILFLAILDTIDCFVLPFVFFWGGLLCFRCVSYSVDATIHQNPDVDPSHKWNEGRETSWLRPPRHKMILGC